MELTNINIEERMKHYNVLGLSITLINKREICVTDNYGFLETGTNRSVTTNSIFSACSISKLLTAMLVLKLTEQGLLDLDEDINKKLVSWKVPESDFTVIKKVTLRNLLSHQSGIKDPADSFSELKTNNVPSMVELLEGSSPFCKESIEVKV